MAKTILTNEQLQFLTVCESLINLGMMEFEYPASLSAVIKCGFTLDSTETLILKKVRESYINHIKENK